MARETGALLNLAESVADGAAIDWEAAERQASDADRAVIRQLRVLATLGLLHRTLPAIPEGPGAPPRSITAPAIGRWGHLSLLERLGGGTFGDVYRAWDAQLERQVALKLLRHSGDLQDQREPRIVQEARRLARIRHQNVVTVYGVDAHDEHVGLWMELIQGTTLEEAIAKRGVFSAREAALIGIDLCHALAAIHGAGLLHRDVKAQNVMREDGGRIVLMDLGTGREMSAAGGPGDLAGTPLYLAPELFEGAPASVESDIYSLGVLLYRLVTGEFPVRSTTMDGLREGHTQGSMVRLRDARPDLPTGFVSAVDRALGRDPSGRYRSTGSFEADLVSALETPAAVSPGVAPASVQPRWRTWQALALAAMVLLVAGLAVDRWRASGGSAATPSPIPTIAVLPLRNDSGDPGQEYFADGMTDEIISTLGRLGLNVTSRTSSMQFKGLQLAGRTKSLPEIAAALKADAILEGSVLVVPASAGSETRKVRISARLIAAGTDTQIWNETFEEIADDVLVLERKVARAIADGIRLTLSPRQAEALEVKGVRQSGPNFEAFNLYLRGRYYWNLRTKEDLERSIYYFHQAIAKDATYAAPHAGLADAYKLSHIYGSLPYDEAMTRAADEAARAVALDDTIAEAHASLALVHDSRLEWAAAEAGFLRALQLNPSYVSAHHWYGAHLAKRGAFDQALAELDKAIALDPLSVVLRTQLGATRLHARDYDGAVAQLEKVVRDYPDFARGHFILANAYAKRGEYDRALASADRAAELGGGGAELRGLVGCILAAAGRAPEARAVVEELITAYQNDRSGGPVGVAAIYATLGDNDRAFDWLERGLEHRDPLLAFVKVDPWFDDIRGDPRFETLLARLGLTR